MKGGSAAHALSDAADNDLAFEGAEVPRTMKPMREKHAEVVVSRPMALEINRRVEKEEGAPGIVLNCRKC